MKNMKKLKEDLLKESLAIVDEEIAKAFPTSIANKDFKAKCQLDSNLAFIRERLTNLTNQRIDKDFRTHVIAMLDACNTNNKLLKIAKKFVLNNKEITYLDN